MAPSILAARPAEQATPPAEGIEKNAVKETTKDFPKPLQLSGALDAYAESFDVTPVIGREFPKVNLVEVLNAPNSDELLRDLAITSAVTFPSDLMSILTMLQLRNAESSSSVHRTT